MNAEEILEFVLKTFIIMKIDIIISDAVTIHMVIFF